MIGINGLYKTFKIGEHDLTVLKGINLEIRRGELLAIMGASGAGAFGRGAGGISQ